MASSVPQFASLYVGDLHPDVTEAMLYEIFNSVGPVASIRVCRDSVTRKSLGYGYVNFHSVSDAERALDTLNYSSIKGRACRIMWSQRDPSLRKSGLGNVFVKNLDKAIDNKALYDTFSLFGNILSCKVACDPTGKSRGYGFVHYETEEAAKQAIERVNGMQIGEQTVHVSGFVKRYDREKPALVNFTNVYVKNFPADWDEHNLNSVFKASGTITSSCLTTDNKGRRFAFVNFETHEQAEKAIEDFHQKDFRDEEQKAADKEKEEEEKDQAEKSYLLYVQRAQSKMERSLELRERMSHKDVPAPTRNQGVNLYIKNLDESMDDASLKAIFQSFGTITSSCAMRDDKGRCKGFGFVCFASPDEATKAVTEMHLKVVKGKPLYVGLAEKREARQERLRQRYSPSATAPAPSKGMMPMGGKAGGKGGPGMGGFGQGAMGPQGIMYPQMMGGMGAMGGMGMGMGGMGPRPMMGGPQMMGPMGKGGPMGPQMMGGPQMIGPMAGKGMMGPMGGMPMMGMPMMRPPMGGMPMMRPPMPAAAMRPQQQQQQPSALIPGPGQPLTASGLAAAPPAVQKQIIGERLYPQIAKYQPELAGKITGMMLEMDNAELLILLESEVQLRAKVDEALRVLETSK